MELTDRSLFLIGVSALIGILLLALIRLIHGYRRKKKVCSILDIPLIPDGYSRWWYVTEPDAFLDHVLVAFDIHVTELRQEIESDGGFSRIIEEVGLELAGKFEPGFEDVQILTHLRPRLKEILFGNDSLTRERFKTILGFVEKIDQILWVDNTAIPALTKYGFSKTDTPLTKYRLSPK